MSRIARILVLLTLVLSPGAQGFVYDSASMSGRVSYITLRLAADGSFSSVAVTPDAGDPSAWTAPNFPSTHLCRAPGETTEPPDCRSYAVFIPAGYDGKTALPLHLSLHGNGGFAEAQIGDIPKNDGSGNVAADNSGLEGRYNQLAEQHQFLVAYPNGVPNGGNTVNGRMWNDCRIGQPESTADDVRFITALLDDLERSLSVDRTRIYAHGYSNGAMMVLRLYAELGERFTAFATNAGNQPQDDVSECAEPQARKPIFLIYGDLDVVVPYYGVGVRNTMRSADATIEYWTRLLGTETPTLDDLNWMQNWTPVANRSSSDGAPDSRGYVRTYGNGADGTQGVGPTRVMVKKIFQGGHSLSGLTPITDPVTAATLAPKNLDIQVADELYDFFSAHQMQAEPAAQPKSGRFGAALGMLGLTVLMGAVGARIHTLWRARS